MQNLPARSVDIVPEHGHAHSTVESTPCLIPTFHLRIAVLPVKGSIGCEIVHSNGCLVLASPRGFMGTMC